jgi:hypothetical protein
MMLDHKHGILRGKALPTRSLYATLCLICRLAAAAAASGAAEVLLSSPAALEARVQVEAASGAAADGRSQEWLDYKAAGEDEDETILSQITYILDDVMYKIVGLNTEGPLSDGLPDDATPDHVRLQHGRTLAALMLLHPPLFKADGALAHLEPRLQHLLLDASYAVRAAAGQLICALMLVSIDARGFLHNELLQHLPLALPRELRPTHGPARGAAQGAGEGWAAVERGLAAGLARGGDDEGGAPPPPPPLEPALVPFWETGVLQLVEAAVAAPDVEWIALKLLVGHAGAAAGRLAAANADTCKVRIGLSLGPGLHLYDLATVC